MRELLSIDVEREAAAAVVVAAGGVIDDGEDVAMVGQAVEGEVAPLAGGQEWMQDEGVVGARAQAEEAGDERVSKAGVVVVVAAADLLALPWPHPHHRL